MIYYIYREQEYKSILPLNEESIFESGGKVEKWYRESGKHKISPIIYLLVTYSFLN